jgi:hypothetical protein
MSDYYLGAGRVFKIDSCSGYLISDTCEIKICDPQVEAYRKATQARWDARKERRAIAAEIPVAKNNKKESRL